MTTYTNGHNGNGSQPRLSDSLASDLRCLIHRHEPAFMIAERLADLEAVMCCVRTEDGRVRWLNAQLAIYADAEALFGGEA